MAVILKLKCPDCAEVFKWPGEQKWPAFCPLCQAPQSTNEGEVCMPFISTSGRAKANDSVYKQMEAGSEVRAQIAAETLGLSAADVSDLKITNLKSTYVGEQAHVPVVNEVSRLMDKAPDATGFQAQGVNFSGGVQSGPLPNTGAKFQTQIRKMHAQVAGWGAMSDNPSNEVMQPGYRRRA